MRQSSCAVRERDDREPRVVVMDAARRRVVELLDAAVGDARGEHPVVPGAELAAGRSRPNSTRMPFSSASSVPAGGTGMPSELAEASRSWNAVPSARSTVARLVPAADARVARRRRCGPARRPGRARRAARRRAGSSASRRRRRRRDGCAAARPAGRAARASRRGSRSSRRRWKPSTSSRPMLSTTSRVAAVDLGHAGGDGGVVARPLEGRRAPAARRDGSRRGRAGSRAPCSRRPAARRQGFGSPGTSPVAVVSRAPEGWISADQPGTSSSSVAQVASPRIRQHLDLPDGLQPRGGVDADRLLDQIGIAAGA